MIIDLQEQCNLAIQKLEKTESRQDLEQAEDIFNALLNIDDGAAEIYFYLGTVFIKKKYYVLAEKMFRLANECNDKLFCVWNNLGYVLRENRKKVEAREAFKKAIELNPKDSDCFMNLGGVHIASGEPEKAIEYSTKALDLNPENQHALWNRALAYFEKGEYTKGWSDYDAGVRTRDRYHRFYQDIDKVPLWDGTKGKTVVVYGEQGIGDEIMFASMIPDVVRDANVIFETHPRLYKIFRDSFPDLQIYGTRKEKVIHWNKFHKIDYAIPIGSLGKFYRNKTEDFPQIPYLKADPVLNKKMQDKLNGLGEKCKIGFSWKGGTKPTNDTERHIALHKWLPIFKSINADWISLQYKDGAEEEIEKFLNTKDAKDNNIKIHHWRDIVDNYDLTCALVNNLDFVISVPQSVVHLSGALGIPTIQLTPKHALWQMGVYGQNMPWYDCVKNIWQDETLAWEPVIEKAKEDLCNLYQMSIAS